jgi:tetratricopeptide (TPR) repeat protein
VTARLFVLTLALLNPAAVHASAKASYEHFLKAVLLGNQGSFDAALKEYDEALAADPQSAYMYQQAAELALEAGRPEKALELARRFAKLDPANPDAFFLLGNVAWARGDAQGAQEAFEKTLALQPRHEKALFALGNLLSSESPEKAKTYFERFLKDNPENSSDAEYQIALIEHRAGRLPSAREHLDAALRLNPDNMPARYSLAQMLEVSFDTAAALDAFSDILQRDPRNVPLLNHVGEIYLNMDDPAKARERFLRAKEVLPDHPATCLWLALMAEQEKDYAGAARQIQDSSALKDEAQLNLRLSYYLTQAGQLKEAVAVLEKANARWPENEEIAYFLALGYDDLKSSDKAVDILLKIIRQDPGHRDARFQLGVVYERGGRMAEAEAQFREILQRNPFDAAALNYLGYSLADRGLKLQEAESLVRRAVDLDPKNGAYLDSLGWAHFKAGRSSEAVAELMEAVRLMPDDEAIWDHLGDAYHSRGDTVTAWDCWKMSCAGAPAKPALLKKLSKAESLLSAEEIGEGYVRLFKRQRGGILDLGSTYSLTGEIVGKPVQAQGLLRFHGPRELSIEALGPLFVTVFRASMTGEDGFEMDSFRVEGVPQEAVREAFLAGMTLLRGYLSGSLFSPSGAVLRKAWRQQTIETPSAVFYPDAGSTRLEAIKDSASGLRLVLGDYRRIQGRWIPSSLSFEGKGFAFRFLLSDPAVRFR